MNKFYAVLLTSLVYAQSASAFTVINSTSGASAANYGNSVTPEYKKAIEGDSDLLTPEEQQKILSKIPPKFNDNWYVGFRNNWFDYKLSSYSNKSNPPLDSLEVPQTTFKKRGKSISGMVGYMFDGFSVDGELLIGTKLNPTFGGGGIDAGTLTVKNRTLMLNAYWDFIDLAGLKPFLLAGGGVAQNKATTEFNVGGLKTDNTRYAFAWNVGVGLRFRVVSHFFIEAMARYIRNGEVEIKEKSEPDLKLRTRLSSQGYSIGLIVAF